MASTSISIREPVVYNPVAEPADPWCVICMNTAENPNNWVAHNRPEPVTSTIAESSSSSTPPPSEMIQTARLVCAIHEKCLETWFTANATCPHCRAPVSENSSPAPSRQALDRLENMMAPLVPLIDIPIFDPSPYRLIGTSVLAAYTTAIPTCLGLLTSLLYFGKENVNIQMILPAVTTTVLLGTASAVTRIAFDRNNPHSFRSYTPPLLAAALTSFVVVQIILFYG